MVVQADQKYVSKMEKKVILLTGASGALGTQIAASLKASGHQLVLQYNENPVAGSENVFPVQCDLCNVNSIREMVQAAVARFGKIDVLINNAGISRSSVSWKTTEEDWDQTIRINLNAPFFLSQAVIPHMRENGSGRIVNISSVVAQTGFVGTSAYAASKAGLIGLTKTLSKELARFKITVNAIALGYFNVGMISDVPQEAQEKLLGQVPMNQLGDPATLIKTIEFLLSDEAGFVTGQTINLNGGLYS